MNINKQLKQKTYPMPKINEIFLKLEGFQYATLFKYGILSYPTWKKRK